MSGTSQQNYVAERMNRTLMNKVRSMISLSILSSNMWSEALKIAVYTLNMILSKQFLKHPLSYGMDGSLI